MLKATEANRMANAYYGNLRFQLEKDIENIIVDRANEGYKWAEWDYELTQEITNATNDDVNYVIQELRNAGYDVKLRSIIKTIIIRW